MSDHVTTTEATVELIALSFDANDPQRQAYFWAEALRWDIDDAQPDAIRLVPTDDTGFAIEFRHVPDAKSGQNRQHFDLTTESVEDKADTIARLIELGARHIDIGQSPDETHVVLADPEGNEFCVIDPDNNFLADCPRLGAVNCDGTQALGYFWSRALGWPLVWDQDEETAIHDPDGVGPKITWSGPPLMPATASTRIRFDIAPPDGRSRSSVIDQLVALGATVVDGDQGVMADPDGNEFLVGERGSPRQADP